MNLYTQSVIAEKRGEPCLAFLLREIIKENQVTLRRKEKAKKVVFQDNDY